MQVKRLLRARPQQKVEDTTKLRMLYSQLGRKLFCKKKKKKFPRQILIVFFSYKICGDGASPRMWIEQPGHV